MENDGFALHGRDLRVVFGGVVAVDSMSVSVTRGAVTGLVGPNGAGKTSVLNLLSGFYAPHAGEITLESPEGTRSLTRMPINQRARLGIGRTFQTPKLFHQMRVWENVAAARVWRTTPAAWLATLGLPGSGRERAEMRNETTAVLREFSLQDKADFAPSQLSLGEQRLVEIARAVFGRSRLILLDEPFAGLSTDEKERLSLEIEELRRNGVGVLLIEHNLEVVRRLADSLIVMDQGRELLRGDPAQVLGDKRVIEVFLGEEIAA